MKQIWHTIDENQTYLGDLKDFNGRRIAFIVHKGIGVFAQCPVEKHYLFKEDFEALANTLDFVQGAKIENGLFTHSKDLDLFFDHECLEEIYSFLVKSLEK